MDVRGIDDFDLMGVLFVYFPPEVPEAECRERLETEILFAAMEDGAEEDGFEVAITPYWVTRALIKRGFDEVKAMKGAERREVRKAAWERRKERLAASGVKTRI